MLDMTQESLFDALVYTDIPSRTALTSVLQDGLLKKSIFASNAFIYHFDDIRDAIDLVLRGLREGPGIIGDKHNYLSEAGISRPTARSTEDKAPHPPPAPLFFHLNHTVNNSCLKMNELFNSEEVRFACSRGSEDLLNARSESKATVSLPSATILVSLDFLGPSNGHVPFERVDVLMEKMKSLLVEFGGPILAFSEIRRNLQTGTTFKFFAEFYRTSDCKKFLQTSERIGSPVVSDQNVQVTFQGVHLYDIDREALFFSAPTEVNAVTHNDQQDLEEDQIAPEQRRKNSISSIEGKLELF